MTREASSLVHDTLLASKVNLSLKTYMYLLRTDQSRTIIEPRKVVYIADNLNARFLRTLKPIESRCSHRRDADSSHYDHMQQKEKHKHQICRSEMIRKKTSSMQADHLPFANNPR